ncbi:gp53-like domain-containing protein [Burkholderia multivorans]|uniref:gp53-like domain-containing protein n=1 Tax=Burkholderia multivorans TaxID=87883 RepID=UPI0021BED0D8|nr:hypothetical protein [Burkholderia multivorans]
MATQNDFLPFATGPGANVVDQATYAALGALTTGFLSGTAQSGQLNKVWRQSSIMAAVLGQFIANFSGQNAIDDGTTATLLANLKAAINAAGITAPQFDNSTKHATTAFVQRALGNFQGATALNAASTLPVSTIGQFLELTGSSSFTTTLPAASACPGGNYLIWNNSSVPQTLSTSSGLFFGLGQSGGSSTRVVQPLDTLTITSDGFNWIVNGGGGFGSSLGAAGYQKLPSGLIIQWGLIATSSSAPVTWTYPIAFPNAALSVVGSVYAANSSAILGVNIGTLTASSTTVAQATSSGAYNAGSVRLIAIGY